MKSERKRQYERQMALRALCTEGGREVRRAIERHACRWYDRLVPFGMLLALATGFLLGVSLP